MLIAYEFYFLNNKEEKIKSRLAILCPFLITLMFIPLTLQQTSFSTLSTTRIATITAEFSSDQGTGIHPVDITRARGATLSRTDYFLTEMNVLVTYIRLLFLPVNQNIDYDYPLFPANKIPTLFCAFLLMLLIGIAIKTFNRHRLISWGIFWFFLTLSIESSFVPIGHVIAEYRLYPALLGFAVVLTAGIFLLSPDLRKSRILLAAGVLIFSITTIQRNQLWKDEVSLWEDTVRKSPNKVRPWNNLGKVYTDRGHFTRAKSCFEKVLLLDPQNSDGYMNLGVIFYKENQFDQAIEFYKKAFQIDPRNYTALLNLGLAYGQKGDYAQETFYYKKSIELNPKLTESYFFLGISAIDTGDKKEVLRQIDQLRKLKADEPADRLQKVLLQNKHK